MGGKVKLTVTVEADLVTELDNEAKMLKVSRSALVEKAIKGFRDSRLEDRLKRGYQAMADENLRVAEESIGYGTEVFDDE
jgi:metal-responsive CopG/Arc/MetJ family transcriptional regulator